MNASDRLTRRIEQSLSIVESRYGKDIRKIGEDLIKSKDLFKMIDFCEKYINPLYNITK
jgi:hypothetical protein